MSNTDNYKRISCDSLHRLYLYLRVEGNIFFPKIEFDFIRSGSYREQNRYLSAFLSTSICNFHLRRFCATVMRTGRKLRTTAHHPSFYRAVRGAHICVKFASTTREPGNLLFHFVNESDITSRMRCKWPRDMVEVQVPAGWVFT